MLSASEVFIVNVRHSGCFLFVLAASPLALASSNQQSLKEKYMVRAIERLDLGELIVIAVLSNHEPGCQWRNAIQLLYYSRRYML